MSELVEPRTTVIKLAATHTLTRLRIDHVCTAARPRRQPVSDPATLAGARATGAWTRSPRPAGPDTETLQSMRHARDHDNCIWEHEFLIPMNSPQLPLLFSFSKRSPAATRAAAASPATGSPKRASLSQCDQEDDVERQHLLLVQCRSAVRSRQARSVPPCLPLALAPPAWDALRAPLFLHVTPLRLLSPSTIARRPPFFSFRGL
jgi:hypothetical protein